MVITTRDLTADPPVVDDAQDGYYAPDPTPAGMFRVIEADGTLVPGRSVAVPDEDLLEMLRLMTLARRIDQEGAALQRQGELGIWVPLIGQEAAQIGSAYALDRGDWAFTYGREHAVGLVRGVSAADMAHVWRGTWHGGLWNFREHGFAPYTVPIGTQILHAVGFALGAKLDRSGGIAMAFFGDGATSTGDFHSGCTFAGVWRAPAVLVCQNNGYAISVPVSKQTAAPCIAAKAVGYGFPGVRVDGNDVVACYLAAREAVERARRGEGPTLIEAVTYRVGAHSTADDATRYRSEDEVRAWRARDPLSRFTTFLLGAGILTAEIEERYTLEAESAAAVLREAVVGAETPDPRDLFEHVYESPSPTLAAQRDAVARSLDEDL